MSVGPILPCLVEFGDFPSFCLGGQKSPLLAFAPLLNEEDARFILKCYFFLKQIESFGE